MAKRAERRAHRERYQERNRRNYQSWPDAWKFGDTRCRCGRSCCNRPRMYYGLTIQERREMQYDRE